MDEQPGEGGVTASTNQPAVDQARMRAHFREYFEGMIDRCYDYAASAKASGRPIVGIMCEFTPREIIFAAGAVPVCLCGGSAATISAAERVLPNNLCPLIKSTFGYHLTGKNPFLKWADLVVAETTCDGKKKMFELLGADRPMHVLELPHKAGDSQALEYWVTEVRKLCQRLEEAFGVTITDEKLRNAIRLMNRERGLRRQLASLMQRDRPPLTGRELLDMKSIISGIDQDLDTYDRSYRWLEEARPSGGQATREGPVRVLLTGVPVVHGAERVVELIENAGAVIVCMENCTGLKPILDDIDERSPDPLRAIAEKYYHLPCSVMTPNRQRIESLRRLVNEYHPECVVELVWQACLTYDIESYQVKRFVEEELRLPYLKVTTDYGPADSARISARVEALLETLRSRRIALAQGGVR